jgi:hypothetical protein
VCLSRLHCNKGHQRCVSLSFYCDSCLVLCIFYGIASCLLRAVRCAMHMVNRYWYKFGQLCTVRNIVIVSPGIVTNRVDCMFINFKNRYHVILQGIQINDGGHVLCIQRKYFLLTSTWCDRLILAAIEQHRSVSSRTLQHSVKAVCLLLEPSTVPWLQRRSVDKSCTNNPACTYSFISSRSQLQEATRRPVAFCIVQEKTCVIQSKREQ